MNCRKSRQLSINLSDSITIYPPEMCTSGDFVYMHSISYFFYIHVTFGIHCNKK